MFLEVLDTGPAYRHEQPGPRPAGSSHPCYYFSPVLSEILLVFVGQYNRGPPRSFALCVVFLTNIIPYSPGLFVLLCGESVFIFTFISSLYVFCVCVRLWLPASPCEYCTAVVSVFCPPFYCESWSDLDLNTHTHAHVHTHRHTCRHSHTHFMSVIPTVKMACVPSCTLGYQNRRYSNNHFQNGSRCKRNSSKQLCLKMLA